jgi:hypothetical protein
LLHYAPLLCSASLSQDESNLQRERPDGVIRGIFFTCGVCES